jgi:hypothetical protein
MNAHKILNDIIEDAWEDFKLIAEDYIVKNKKSGAIYSVKSVNNDKHEPLEMDSNGKPIERSAEEAEAKSREMHASNSVIQGKEKKSAESAEKNEAKADAIKSAKENPKAELSHMDKAIFEDKSYPFYVDKSNLIKHIKPVSNRACDESSVSTLQHNSKELIKAANSKGALSKQDVEQFQNAANLIIKNSVNSGVTESAINNIINDSIAKILFQEDESRKHGMGDHGIRHIYGNMKYTDQALNELDSTVKTTPREKMMAQLIMTMHDLGYAGSVARTPGMKGIYASSAHKEVSTELVNHMISKGKWKDLNLTKKEKAFVLNAVLTHDSSEMDFEKQPVLSSIRMSDNLAVFKAEKIPYVFNIFGEEKTKTQLGDLRKINVKIEKFENELTKQYIAGNITGEEYNNKLIKVKEVQKHQQNKVKKSLIETVNNNTEYNDIEKKYLLTAIDEISPWTTKAIPGMYAGQIKKHNGITFNKNKNNVIQATIILEHNKFNEQLLDAGLDLGNKQFEKVAESFGLQTPKKPKLITDEEISKLNPNEIKKVMSNNLKLVKQYEKDMKLYNDTINKGKFVNDKFKIIAKQLKNEVYTYIKCLVN